MKLRSLLCFLIAIPLGILRIFVMKTSVELQSGFYVKGTYMPCVFTLLCICALILFAVVSLSCREKKYSVNLKGGISSFAGTAVFAMTLLLCAVTAFLDGYTVMGVLAGIGAVSLIIGAPAHMISEKALYLPVFLLIPSVWCAYNLITVFRRYSTIVTISDYLLQVLSLTALLLFVFYSAKMYIDRNCSAILHFSAYAADKR